MDGVKEKMTMTEQAPKKKVAKSSKKKMGVFTGDGKRMGLIKESKKRMGIN
jgi:hypothetical protein